MADAAKEWLFAKRFGVVHYISNVVQFLCFVVLISITSKIASNEDRKFSGCINAKTLLTTTTRKHYEEECFKKYKKVCYPSVPLYGFVLLSFGLPLLVSVIYSLIVSSRVDEIATIIETPNNNSDLERAHAKKGTVRVFVWYFALVTLKIVIAVSCITSVTLQLKRFYAERCHSEFPCNLTLKSNTGETTTSNISHNINKAYVTCKNSSASEKKSCSIALTVINILIVFILICEFIYISCRAPIKCNSAHNKWHCDKEFVITYFLRKLYSSSLVVESRLLLENGDGMDPVTRYKREILFRGLSHEINYVGMHSIINDIYVDVLIETERAKHEFSKTMKRHEIYNVYQSVPLNSIRLINTVDIFKPNEDTKGETPHRILIISRPGIGKTVITEKILRDWTDETDRADDFYSDKFVFLFKFRWFIHDNMKNISLFEFLRCGTSLNKKFFLPVYNEIIRDKLKTIFLFDGLDESNITNPLRSMEESSLIPNDYDSSLSANIWFIKLASGKLFKSSTIFVTSRPTAENLFSKFRFDRNLEVLGFTEEKVKEYVCRFCKNMGKSSHENAMLNHIKSSSDISNLCYIPVNCFIVCLTLSGCLDKSQNDTGIFPTTITELYTSALNYLENYEQERNEDPITREVSNKLQKLAFEMMTYNKLIYDGYKHNINDGMKKSPLLNSLPNYNFSSHVKFCFIHLTIKEFVAAKHVTECFKPNEIREFILQHFKNGRWH